VRTAAIFVLAMFGTGGHAAAPAPDVMLVLDLPSVAADETTQTQSVRTVADTLPVGSRLGVVSSDKSGGNLRAALMSAAEAAAAVAATDYPPAVDKDPASAFERALYELRITGRNDAPHAIVFLGDAVPADAERRQWLRDSLTVEAARMETRVFVVAWGETADIELAQTMARATDGEYFRAASVAELERLMPRLGDMLSRDARVEAQPVPASPTTQALATVPAPQPQPMPVVQSSTPDPNADRLAGWVLAGLVGIGAILGGIAAWLIGRRHAPRAGRGAVRATPAAYLVDVHGVTPLSRYVLGSRPVMIGRVAGKDTRLFDYITVAINTVSRRHAVIEYRDGTYWVVDQGSVNGTRVNDKRIKGKRALQHGDRIGLHRCELQFELAEPSSDLDRTVSVTETMAAPNKIPAAAAMATASVAAAAKSDVGRTQPPPVDPTVVLSLSDVTGPLPGEAVAAAVAEEGAMPKKSTLDSFISTTLIQSSPPNATQPTRPELPPQVAASAPSGAENQTSELSIDDFLDAGDPFSIADEPMPAVERPAAPHQTTQKLESGTESADIDDFKLGDTINLFEPGQTFEETTPLEMFLREHTGEPSPERESNVVKGAWEQSRKK
jgi:pSer/pThr/pTyr-binding forkhead associated (FHA) protein